MNADERRLTLFLAASLLVTLGMFIHVLLFNLYLADLGFREDFMGRQASLMTLGTAAGTLPWAAMARRRGLRFTCIAALAGLAIFMVLRVHTSGAYLSAASFLLGIFLGGWFVTQIPAIAAFSTGAGGFSLNVSMGIGIGAAGGLIGGHLPQWLGSKQAALSIAATPLLPGALIIAAISFPQTATVATASFRVARSFLLRFLPAVALWYAFGAGFIPFFNAYLRNRMGASVATIGGVFALVHICHAAAALLMPKLSTRLGLARAVVLTQILAAAGVLAMWPVDSLRIATALYIFYGSFQVMSEPGLQNLLMRGVPQSERAAAMAANLLLMFSVQAGVGAAAGKLIVDFGYGALFIALGVTGLAAAAIFALLFERASLADSAPHASATQMPGVPLPRADHEAADRSTRG